MTRSIRAAGKLSDPGFVDERLDNCTQSQQMRPDDGISRTLNNSSS
jgi:hypothetical protein